MQAESAKPKQIDPNEIPDIGVYAGDGSRITHLVFVGKESSMIYPMGIGANKCEVKKPEDGAEIHAYFEDGSFHLEIKGKEPCKGTATINFDNGRWHKFNYEILES